ncbi:hypothetical protein [Pseudomonas piscis]|uniref:hypothetical protein n=1 Tax=Pseudomonas piscis TaxID=2614538 RepID=UPI0021D56E22|nr:hypothetical protein [Pseudomonas piscis]MCU7645677.1 hypothetical protein [Pseudomonas piscis]
MTKAALIVRKPDGTILYDTSKSIYGLIKSGPVEFDTIWRRLQPSGGPHIYYDNIYKFVVKNALSPIVFVVGACNQPVMSKEGSDTVFYFAGQVADIKVYCFDLMAPIFTGPALKTRAEDGVFTFNSLQHPMNIIGTSIAPPPTMGPSQFGNPFAGGNRRLIVPQYLGGSYLGGYYEYYVEIFLDGSKTYASHIPWSRGCVFQGQLPAPDTDIYRGSLHEGCYGMAGGIVHNLWTSPETTYGNIRGGPGVQQGVTNLQVEPRPQCSYIDVSEYPYPFDPPR